MVKINYIRNCVTMYSVRLITLVIRVGDHQSTTSYFLNELNISSSEKSWIFSYESIPQILSVKWNQVGNLTMSR